MHEGISEHPVEFYVIVFQDVLQTALGTVLGQDAARCDARSDEPDQVIVVEVLHLETTHRREQHIRVLVMVMIEDLLPFHLCAFYMNPVQIIPEKAALSFDVQFILRLIDGTKLDHVTIQT